MEKEVRNVSVRLPKFIKFIIYYNISNHVFSAKGSTVYLWTYDYVRTNVDKRGNRESYNC